MENRLCPLSLGLYLWVSAVNGSVHAHQCVRVCVLRQKRGKTSAEIRDRKSNLTNLICGLVDWYNLKPSIWKLTKSFRGVNNAAVTQAASLLGWRGGPDDKRPFIFPTRLKDNSRLGPCCGLGGLALLLSLWTCESPVTDGRDILPYLLPFPVTCNMYSFLKSQQLSTLSPHRPASTETKTVQIHAHRG